jgi:hypothetical protein
MADEPLRWSSHLFEPDGTAGVSVSMYGVSVSMYDVAGTTWELAVRRPDAVVCPDGGAYDGTSTRTWDAKTLEGSMSLLQLRDDCGDDWAPVPAEPFTLSKVSDDALPPGMQSS